MVTTYDGSLFELLNDDSVWDDFILYKERWDGDDSKRIGCMRGFIEARKYKRITESLLSGDYRFTIPRKRCINKMGTDKKRIVYSFTFAEMMVLKVASFLLHKYDGIFADNLYSYRCDVFMKDAISSVSKQLARKPYCYKVDISNYFNSIDWPLLKNDVLSLGDSDLSRLCSMLLDNEYVIENGECIIEKEKGVMAGVPLSAFLANLYLNKVDLHFQECGVSYYRYADDIIIMSEEGEDLSKQISNLHYFLNDRHLKTNPRKEVLYQPGDTIQFLGFSLCNGRIDIADSNIRKMKMRIRRNARSIRRWMLRKGASPQSALKVMNRKFNYKFYGTIESEISWSRWYFPVINTDAGLRIIDTYMQDELRFIVTGAHNKLNKRKVPYEMLKKTGYRPLVSEYWHWKRTGGTP